MVTANFKTVEKGLKYWLAFGAIYIIWGTTYLAIKIGIEDFPPLLWLPSGILLPALFSC